jgi:hypothetical protein
MKEKAFKLSSEERGLLNDALLNYKYRLALLLEDESQSDRKDFNFNKIMRVSNLIDKIN